MMKCCGITGYNLYIYISSMAFELVGGTPLHLEIHNHLALWWYRKIADKTVWCACARTLLVLNSSSIQPSCIKGHLAAKLNKAQILLNILYNRLIISSMMPPYSVRSWFIRWLLRRQDAMKHKLYLSGKESTLHINNRKDMLYRSNETDMKGKTALMAMRQFYHTP